MPELPEVEVTRRGFVEQIRGARILSTRLGKPLRWPLGCSPEALTGRTVLDVRRRGKYLLVDLSEGLLMLHLGMSGRLLFAPQLPPAGKHDHFDLSTTQGVLRLHDPRRFGAAVLVDDESDERAQKLLSRLGMEPLDPSSFTFERFWAGLQASSAVIKSLLLAGHLVVGVGNIYACEVLFASGIHPQTSARDISQDAAQRLFEAIRRVLAAALEQGGTTLRDFANVHGVAGSFQNSTQVYGRMGAPCVICGEAIALLRQGQRSTYYCPSCQRA